MELKDIAAVSGKGGLFKVLKPSKAGVILESLDDKKQKLVAGVHHKVSILDEISIYTHTSEGSTPLLEVFHKIFSEFDADPGVDSSSSPDELKSFFKYILSDYDESKVYASDMKKILNWYKVLYKEAPEILKSSPEEEHKPEEENNKKEEGKGQNE
jgi:hypothetical protein